MSTSAVSGALRHIAPVVDRRVSTRVAAIVPVELVFAHRGAGVLAARSVDVGMGGICVTTESPIDRSAVRRIRFAPGHEQLELSVTGRWSSKPVSDEGPLTGFSFDSVDPRSEAVLWDFVHARARDLSVFLRSCDGLDHLDFQDALELALSTRLREVACGDLIYGGLESESCASIFVLFRGSVLLERATDRRNEQIAYVQPGEIFGGIPTIAGCTSFERATTTSSSTILEFLGYNVEYLISAKPPLGIALMRAATLHWMRRFSEMLDRTDPRSAPC